MRKLILTIGLSCLVIALTTAQERKDSVSGTRPINMSIFNESKSQSMLGLTTPAFSRFQLNQFYEMGTPLLNPTFKTWKAFKPDFTVNAIPVDNQYRFFPVDRRSWISTVRLSNNYYGLGGMLMYNASYNRRLTDFLTFSGGIYTSKFNVYNNFYNSAGVNGNIRFKVNDRISINMFGQYSATDNKRPLLFLSTMYPQTNYGGSIEFKVTDKWGIITGTEREYDDIQHKWVTRPFIMPVFYSH